MAVRSAGTTALYMLRTGALRQRTRRHFPLPLSQAENRCFSLRRGYIGSLVRPASGSPQQVEAEWLDIREISDWSRGDPWLDYDHVMISILPLVYVGENAANSELLHQVAIPLDSLARTVPARGTRLDIVGFPMLIDLDGSQVPPPYVWSAFVASGELNLPESSGIPPGFLASPPGTWNFVGAPAFRHDDEESDIRLVGLVIRFLPQNPDVPPNWAFILPAGVISDLIQTIE